MRLTFSSIILAFALGFESAIALPAPGQAGAQAQDQASQVSGLLQGIDLRGMSANDILSLLQGLNAQQGAQAGAGQEEAAAGEAEGEADVGEGEVANEVELEGQFDIAVAVQGGELKQDIVYTPSTVGSFEYEFQAAAADEVTVSENAAPAPPPTGFEAIEPSSYIVSLAQSKGAGLTLSKIDYIFDTTAVGLAGKDVTQAQVGKLCPDSGSFVISESLGELEFELEENEVTLNLNKNVTAEGEWGIFLPVTPATAGDEAEDGARAGKGAGNATAPAEAGKNEGGNTGAGDGEENQSGDESDDDD